MDQQVNKGQMPRTTPPPYSESVDTPNSVQGNVVTAYSVNAGPSYPPSMVSQVPAEVIFVQSPVVPPLGSLPVQVTCPTCRSSVMTSVEESSTNTAYLCCMLMLIIGCIPCCCVPFCMDSFKNYKHTCPKCNAFIGAYQPS